MIKPGVNSVLFKNYTFAEAARAVSMAGYDCIEISAIKGMCEHLDLDSYKTKKAEIKAITEEFGLEIISSEVASLDPERLEKAFEAAAELGIPVINVGPGGKAGDEDSIKQTIEKIAAMAERAAKYGVTLCCKAHYGSSVNNTETTLRLMNEIKNPHFGIDMDPSHIYRSGEEPDEALAKVISRVRHIHVRDCKGRQRSPGEPPMQACGRGDIDLYKYFGVMMENGYTGPVSLEIIGPAQEYTQAAVIAAESRGFVNACLKQLEAGLEAGK